MENNDEALQAAMKEAAKKMKAGSAWPADKFEQSVIESIECENCEGSGKIPIKSGMFDTGSAWSICPVCDGIARQPQQNQAIDLMNRVVKRVEQVTLSDTGDSFEMKPDQPTLKRGDRVILSDDKAFADVSQKTELFADLGPEYEHRYLEDSNGSEQTLVAWKYCKPEKAIT